MTTDNTVKRFARIILRFRGVFMRHYFLLQGPDSNRFRILLIRAVELCARAACGPTSYHSVTTVAVLPQACASKPLATGSPAAQPLPAGILPSEWRDQRYGAARRGQHHTREARPMARAGRDHIFRPSQRPAKATIARGGPAANLCWASRTRQRPSVRLRRPGLEFARPSRLA